MSHCARIETERESPILKLNAFSHSAPHKFQFCEPTKFLRRERRRATFSRIARAIRRKHFSGLYITLVSTFHLPGAAAFVVALSFLSPLLVPERERERAFLCPLSLFYSLFPSGQALWLVNYPFASSSPLRSPFSLCL